MLKRIVLVDGDGGLREKVEAATRGENVEILEIPSSAPLPAGTASLFTPGDPTSEAVELVLRHAAQHEELLDLVALAIDCREEYVEGATQRVKEHAIRFAKAMGLEPDERVTFERAALVHDIGKLKIPNDVLLKKSVLTYDAWMLLQSHSHIGGEMLEKIDALRDTAEAVRTHHECYDGTGYPDGLEREGIPRLGRAMKIIDVYCAMTSPRHYRQGQSTHEDALDYLKSEAGKHFDPELISLFAEAEVGQPLAATKER